MDDFLWRRLLGLDGSNETWLAVVFLIGLFCVAIWQPQRIVRPTLFRTAYILFALSILVPAFTEVIFRITTLGTADSIARRGAFGTPLLVSSTITLVGRVVFGISVVCALGSLEINRRKPESSDVPEA